MTIKEKMYQSACAELEAAVIYRDFIGQISGFCELAKSCDLRDRDSVVKSLELSRAYLPLIEAMEQAVAASRTIIGIFEETAN